jgi:WD40 repeat protein
MGLASLADAGQIQPVQADLYGDPLPKGASARLGTVRWRHGNVILFAAFLPDGKHVVSASDDGSVRVWEFPSGKEIRRIIASPLKEAGAALGSVRGYLTAAALSPDGKTIATSFSAGRYNAGFGGPGAGIAKTDAAVPEDIRLHDLTSGKEVASLKAQSRLILALAFTGNGQTLTSRDSTGIVRIWDWASAKELAMIASRGADAPQHGYDDYSIDDFLVTSPDGKTLMFAGLSNVLQFADSASGKPLLPGGGHLAPIKSIRFTPDGKRILAQDNDWSTHLWDVKSSKDLGALKQPRSARRIPTIISPDGRLGVELPTSLVDNLGPFGGKAAAAAPVPDIEAVLFDAATGKDFAKIPFKRQSVQIVFSPDSKILAASLGTDQKVELFDVVTAKPLRSLVGVPAPAARVLKGGGPGGAGGGLVGRTSTLRNLLFSPDGKMLAFYYTNASTSVTLFDTATGKPAGSLVLQDQFPTANAAFSADGRCLALEMNNGSVALFELATGQVRGTFGSQPPPPDNGAKAGPMALDFVGVAGQRGSGWRGPSTRIAAGPSFALSPDGKALLQVGRDQVVRLWDLRTGAELAAYTGHQAAVTAVAFAPDGKTVVTASDDTTALLWDISNLDRPTTLKNLRPDDLTASWQALTKDDAAKAFLAMGELAQTPEQAVTLIKEKIKPAAPLDPKRVKELIEQLDSGQYKLRDKASAEILKLGDQVVCDVDKALAANPSPEAKQRLEELRGKLTGTLLHGERLRAYRAVEVLERIGTPQARQVLQILADGAPTALLTTNAQAALRRCALAGEE